MWRTAESNCGTLRPAKLHIRFRVSSQEIGYFYPTSLASKSKLFKKFEKNTKKSSIF
jgi:hypothetical protein